MDRCGYNGPFGWTVSKQKPQCLWLRDKVPGILDGDLNQPQGEEKGCEARPPFSQFLEVGLRSSMFEVGTSIGSWWSDPR